MVFQKYLKLESTNTCNDSNVGGDAFEREELLVTMELEGRDLLLRLNCFLQLFSDFSSTKVDLSCPKAKKIRFSGHFPSQFLTACAIHFHWKLSLNFLLNVCQFYCQ